jgi:hypothetical protein
MLMFRRSPPILGAAVAALSSLRFAGDASAQDSAVVSSEVTVSGERASLQLELDDGQVISVVFADGDVELDGEVIGEYQQGGDLERSWRALLGEAASLEPPQIPALVAGWTPPAELQGELADVAERVRGRLSLDSAGVVPFVQNPGDAGVAGALQALVGRPERLRELAEISDEIDTGPLRVHVGEDVTVGLGETVASTLVVVDGDVQIDGTLDGDLVLLGSNADLGPDARITGSVFHSDADIDGDLDGIVGEVDEIDSRSFDERFDGLPDRPDLPDRLSVEVDSPGPFRSIGRGLAGLLSTFVTFAIAFGAGLGVLYFFPRNLELVSRAARQSAGKSLLVGLAGIVLAIPLWVIGTVLLAISIIGIPFLLIWVPLFPAAFAGAISLGSIGVARNLGGWVSSRELSGLNGLDTTRPALQIGTGVALLLAAFAVANLFEMAGSWLEVFEVIFIIVGILGCVLTAAVGLGAVILSRAGRVQAFAGSSSSAAGSGFSGEDSSLNV